MTRAIPVLDRTPPDELHELWRRYKASGDTSDRDALVLHYKPWVDFLAGRIAVVYPDGALSDFLANGVLGLVDAIDLFDPGRRFKFESYAINRIKRSILDGHLNGGPIGAASGSRL